MALAYATDLATGHSRDFALRSCVLGMRLAPIRRIPCSRRLIPSLRPERAKVDQQTRRAVYHQALLRYIGCNADTHLLSAAWGDEIALRQELHRIDMGNKVAFREVFVRAITRTLAGASPEELDQALERGLAGAAQVNIPVLSGHCEVAQRIAERIGLPEEIRENLGQIYERWDGRGLPHGLSGNAVKVPVRLVTLAQDAIALTDLHGFEAMTGIIAERAGGAYEQELVDVFLAHAESLLAGLDGPVDRATILALEPTPHAMLDEEACEKAYLAIADMIDMRMPFTFGHSRAVASLAGAAAKQMGLPASDGRIVRWAGYAHDIGELSVPVSTWMRAGALTERETDSGGYHRNSRSPDLSPAARILAAAEAFQTARETRPHHAGLSDVAAADKVRAAVKEGKLCPEAVEAVLTCAGQRARRGAPTRLAGLTPREIEVLRLIAAGDTAKEAARKLDIAPKTADNHIQSLYSKIGVTTRAGAALYALERGLVQHGNSSF